MILLENGYGSINLMEYVVWLSRLMLDWRFMWFLSLMLCLIVKFLKIFKENHLNVLAWIWCMFVC